MSEVSRRGLFKGVGLGAVIGVAVGYPGHAWLNPEKLCLDEDLPADSPESRKALRELMQTCNDFDQVYLKSLKAASPTDIAEGQRYLMHLLSTGTELFLEGDAERPEFARIVTPTRKLMGDNADAIYYHAQLRGDRRYRIRGRRTGEVYISLTVHSGDTPGGWATGVVAEINDRKFNFDKDGNFELLLGPDVSSEEGLRTTADTVSVITRHYYQNENYAAADPMLHPQIAIEAVESAGPPPAPSDAQMAERLRALTSFIRANSVGRPMFDPTAIPDWFSLLPNRLGKPAKWTPKDGGGWGAVDNAYSAGMFNLTEDEALVMEGVMPDCVFANVLLWNRFLQSFDYRYRQISLNRRQMQLADDGRFRIVLARRDPGVPNWLDAGDRESGIIYWRFMLPEGDIAPIETRVVSLSEVQSLG